MNLMTGKFNGRPGTSAMGAPATAAGENMRQKTLFDSTPTKEPVKAMHSTNMTPDPKGAPDEDQQFESVEKRLDEGNEDDDLTPQKWRKLDQYINLLQSQPDDTGEFIYLNPGTKGDPYDLQPLIDLNLEKGGSASEEKLNNDRFYTLSKKGITTYINDEPVEFI